MSPKAPAQQSDPLSLVKPPMGDDVSARVERQTYETHCTNIASIIASGGTQDNINLYLTSTDADTKSQ